MLFPLRRCPGLVPLAEIDRDIVIVVGDRPSRRTRPLLVDSTDAAPPRVVLVEDRNFEALGT